MDEKKVLDLDLIAIGGRIKQLRINAGLKQDEVAKAVNMDRSQMSRIEHGAVVPNLKFLKIISVLFNTSIDYIVDGSKSTGAIPDFGPMHDTVIEMLDFASNDKAFLHRILSEFYTAKEEKTIERRRRKDG